MTIPTPDPATARRIATPVLVSAIGLLAVVVVCVAGLVALGKDVSQIVIPVTGIVSSVVPSLIVLLRVMGLESTVDSQGDTLTTVKQAVNGQLDARLAQTATATAAAVTGTSDTTHLPIGSARVDVTANKVSTLPVATAPAPAPVAAAASTPLEADPPATDPASSWTPGDAPASSGSTALPIPS